LEFRGFSIRIVDDELDVFALPPAEFLKPLLDRRNDAPWRIPGPDHNNDPAHAARLLRRGGQRPADGGAAEQRRKLSASHGVTVSRISMVTSGSVVA